MPNTLYLHIGSPKTGTTLVQRHFAQCKALSTHGVHYPMAGRRPDDYAHHAFGHALSGGDYPSAAAIVSEATSGHASTLLSSEAITNCVASPRLFPGFLQFLTSIAKPPTAVRVIVFLREASAFFESMYLQSVKAMELATPFDDYLSARRGWYEALFCNLSAIESIGGRIKLDAYAFLPGSYAENWRQALGFDIALPASAYVNPRLSLKSHAFFRQFDAFRSQCGLDMERREALEIMGRHPSPFDNDIHRYRLHRDGVADAIRSQVLAEAERYSRHEYLLAFSTPGPRHSDAPWVDVDTVELTPGDLAAGERFLRTHGKRTPLSAGGP